MTDISLPMDREAVKAYLPHRDPMLMIHGVTDFGEDWIKAASYVDGDAPYFKGHFPDLPIMPGVLLIETVAQAGALIVSLNKGLDADSFIAFSGVEQARFKKPVYPGNELTIEAQILKSRRGYYKFKGHAAVGGEIAAELHFAATQMKF